MLGIDYISAYRGEDTPHAQSPVACPCYEGTRAKQPVGKPIYKTDIKQMHMRNELLSNRVHRTWPNIPKVHFLLPWAMWEGYVITIGPQSQQNCETQGPKPKATTIAPSTTDIVLTGPGAAEGGLPSPGSMWPHKALGSLGWNWTKAWITFFFKNWMFFQDLKIKFFLRIAYSG